MPRLAKRLSELGLASRAEADDWIARGWVRVDGKVISRLGARIRPEQQITLDPRARSNAAQPVTLLLHKPVGPVAGASDDRGPPALALIDDAHRWPVDSSGRPFEDSHRQYLSGIGAIDAADSGLLLLTQDGRLAQRLRGAPPEREVLVHLGVPGAAGSADGGRAPEPSPAVLALLRHGLALDGEALEPARVTLEAGSRLRFVLHERRPRQVRRMCELVGLAVAELKLLRLGPYRLDGLPPGQWRLLVDPADAS